jgi:hypothetical protein
VDGRWVGIGSAIIFIGDGHMSVLVACVVGVSEMVLQRRVHERGSGVKGGM